MFKLARRWWNYIIMSLNIGFNEHADPKIQLEQAIAEAHGQHKRLKEQAANVIANQTQIELRLARKADELVRTNANARQALIMASNAAKTGNTERATQYTAAAETLADQLIQLESEVADLEKQDLMAGQNSDNAKNAVKQNSRLLQEKITEKAKLLSQLDQAQMQEEMNAAMASLTEAVGEDVPTFSEVQEKIEARYAKAKGVAELTGQDVNSRMHEIEQATANMEAQSRLSQLRSELGLNDGTDTAELPQVAQATAQRTGGFEAE